MRQMFACYGEGKLRPMTSHRFPLVRFREAVATALARQGMGKMVLEMPVVGR